VSSGQGCWWVGDSIYHRRIQAVSEKCVNKNVSQFAADLSIQLEFIAISLDAFDLAELIVPTAHEIADVCLPVGCSVRTPLLATLLQLVKQLAPSEPKAKRTAWEPMQFGWKPGMQVPCI
jgi:hypothetical protein